MASFKKLKSGWQYRVAYKENGEYKKKSANGFSTKKEAQLAALKVENLLHQGKKINDNSEFIEYFENWYHLFKKDKHSKKNNKDIQLSINTAKKFFKHTKMKDIDRNMYQAFINWYGNGRATASVRKVHIYTKACLLDALEEGVIHKDPTRKISPKGTAAGRKEETKFINQDEVIKLIKEVKNGINPKWQSRYLILVGLATGLRFSEVLGLSWKDINFKDKTLRVTKTFDYSETKQLQDTKTPSSKRVISIDDDTLNLLKEYKLATQINGSKYVFLDKHMNHVTNNAVNKSLKRACKRSGINEITFHSLRHTHCSLLIYRKVNIKYISKRLGHSSIMITYQTYGHILDEMDQRESTEVDSMMNELYNAQSVHN
ncbi:site-specific integrase [Marinilactibacillus sp. 15R]|uniref:site-specific integrase n=1 Tax=Marinilactibacillus sp. 15R TaxID=1911586 RepID=UPI00090A432C|nr:site-specific integrase [Marinilactibacillus sp. 15R]API89392.1 site-specific integrase [Marinilactibacillus sp. 15R]